MITKVEHTSAPWTVRETETAIQIRAELEFISVAEMSKQVIGDDGEAYQAAMADARLIAAAPEMLEALESLPLNAFGEDMGNCDAADFVDHSGEFFEAMIKARAAIRKARGE